MKTPIALVALTLVLGAVQAQTAPCAAENDQNNNILPGTITGYAFAGPGQRAFQYTPATNLTARAMQIITDRPISTSTGFMTLEVWTDDGTGQPGTRIAGGTWQTGFSRPAPEWQGANFDRVVILTQGTPYWLVWIEPHSSSLPIEPGGATNLPYVIWNHTSQAWVLQSPAAFKFRLFCSLLDDQNVVPFGNPCANASGSLGTMFTNQAPTVGNADFRIEGSGFPGGALSFMVIGLTPSFPSVPIPGTANCFRSTDAFVTVSSATGTGDVRAAAALGHVAFPLPVPSSTRLTGFYLSAQLAVLDASSTAMLPFVTSNALQVTVY